MEGRRVLMTDGKVLMDSALGYANKQLWCFLKNIDIARAYILFSDPQKTSVLVFEYGDMQDRYEGFTELAGIMKTEDGVNVLLTKPQEVQADA